MNNSSSQTKMHRSLAVHNGGFHADEVTATALLLFFDLVDRDKIKRTRDLNEIALCDYVCDVGAVYDPSEHRFDHHQYTYSGKLSSAGMLLAHLHETGTLSTELTNLLNNSLIRGIDEHDIGLSPSMPGYTHFSHIIANFNPIHYDATAQEEDAAFFEAVEFAQSFLRRFIERYSYTLECRSIVSDAMAESKDLLIFDQPIPWMESFFLLDGLNHPAKFILMPAKEHWKLRGIPPSLEERMALRQKLPEAWAGKMDAELQIITGIPEAVFCHKGRFVSVWKSKEAALRAYKLFLAPSHTHTHAH